MKKILITIVFLFIASHISYAQFNLTGEFRPRLELRHGYRTLPAPDSELAAFVNQRSRISLAYDSEKIGAHFSMQEVRVWGNKGMFDVTPGLGIYQGYVDVKMNKYLSLRLGRQELRYDNQRLFGNNNWNQAGRTHDAALLRFDRNGWKVHVGAAFNQQSERTFGTDYTMNQYKSLNYFWANKKVGEVTFSAIAVADGYQKENTVNTTYLRSTLGGILLWKPGKSTLEIHGYSQGGKTQKGKPIKAWYLHLAAGTTPTSAISCSAGIEVLSGNNKMISEGKYKVFVPLYGATHAFNGHLDYFTEMPTHTSEAGLINPYLKATFKANEKLEIKADYHYFALQNKAAAVVANQNREVTGYLGSEIDLILQYNFTQVADVSIGYSTMFASEAMELIKGGSRKEPNHWAWLMLTVRPVFFKTN